MNGFSVIIPLYNKAAFVRKAVESVLSQTYSDWELIIVDDGSRDESFKVASEAVADCGKARIVRQENAGVSSARNNGVALSKADFVCFLDADDWWAPTFLEEMASLIAEFPDVGIYGCAYTIVNDTLHKTRVAPIAFDEGFTQGYIDYCKVYTRRLCMPLWTGAVSVPRKVFDEMHGFKPQLRLGEDFDLWLRIALKYKVAMTSKPLAYYNQDVDLQNRAVGKLHSPETTEYAFYDEYERIDGRVKQLLDNKRVYGLKKYYLAEEFHDWAKGELAKVDWSHQPKAVAREFRYPVWFLKAQMTLLGYGVRVKIRLVNILKNR